MKANNIQSNLEKVYGTKVYPGTAYIIQDEIEKQLKDKMTEIHISISDFIKDYTIKMDTMEMERKEEEAKLRKRIDELEAKLQNITLI